MSEEVTSRKGSKASPVTSRKGSKASPANRVSLSDILYQLKRCGWYWGELDSEKADTILLPLAKGSFILRDSNDACHLFTLSIKAHKMVISVRVHFSRGLFKLDSSTPDCPSFHSVVDLVDYYLKGDNQYFFVEVAGMGELKVSLHQPVLKNVLPLEHLCRIKIVHHWNSPDAIESLPLPGHLKRYLLEFCPSPPIFPLTKPLT